MQFCKKILKKSTSILMRDKSFEGPRSFFWDEIIALLWALCLLKRAFATRLSCNNSPFAVILGNSTGVDDDKQSKIEAGLAGVEFAKNLSSEIRRAVGIGVLNLTINGTLFVPDEQSLNFSEPVIFCAKGQSFRDGVCGNLFTIIIHIHVKQWKLRSFDTDFCL